MNYDFIVDRPSTVHYNIGASSAVSTIPEKKEAPVSPYTTFTSASDGNAAPYPTSTAPPYPTTTTPPYPTPNVAPYPTSDPSYPASAPPSYTTANANIYT